MLTDLHSDLQPMGRTAGSTNLDRDSVVYEVFWALADHEAALSLRNVQDAAGVTAWARTYHLDAPSIRDFALRQVEWWREHDDLYPRSWVPYPQPIRLQASPALLNPHEWAPLPLETKREFRRRSDALFARFRRLHEPVPLTWAVRLARQSKLEQHVAWFVRFQVMGQSVEDIAGEYDVSTVNKAIAAIARILGVPRRSHLRIVRSA